MFKHEIYIYLKITKLYNRRAGEFYWYSKFTFVYWLVHLFIALCICLLHCTFVYCIVHLFIALYICLLDCTFVYWTVHLFIALYICLLHCTFVYWIVLFLLHCTFVLYSFKCFVCIYNGIIFPISHFSIQREREKARMCLCVCVCVCARTRKKSAFIVQCDVSVSITFEDIPRNVRWFYARQWAVNIAELYISRRYDTTFCRAGFQN
jgi:hypothetical protein